MPLNHIAIKDQCLNAYNDFIIKNKHFQLTRFQNSECKLVASC